MGLKDTLSNVAQTAFIAIGDIPVTTYYYQIASSSYDISSGVVTASTLGYLTSMVFTRYNKRELMNENIKPTDMKGLVPQANISVVPQVNDYLYRIESGVSVRYDVIDKEQDPASAIWKLQLRKP